MAMGDSRGSSNSNKLYENTYYSRVRFKDYDNKLALGFKFKSGMLVVDISKEKDGFQYDTLIEMFITTTKAKILIESINTFIEDVKAGKATPEKGYGINAGMGEIVSVLALHTTATGGTAITIGKVDGSGKFTESHDFNLNTNDFHYGLQWDSIKTMEVSKVYHNDLELEIFRDVLKQFVDNASGAYGYAVADITRYDYRAIMNKMNPIYDKLGIERASTGYGSNRSGGNNFFTNDKPASSNHKSLESLEDELDFN